MIRNKRKCERNTLNSYNNLHDDNDCMCYRHPFLKRSAK